jgi:hypothetical protein
MRRVRAAQHRLEASRARADTREWIIKRRERTRHLIEFGGLVAKAGIVELIDDDRAVLYGALLDVAAKLRGEDGGAALALWRRRGKRAFEDGARTAGKGE